MSRRAVRVSLWLLACAVVGAAAWLVNDTERQIAAVRSTARVFDAQAVEASVLLERLRGAQRGYVAEGQGPAFWMNKVTEASGLLGQAVASLERTATSDSARGAAQAASSALSDFEEKDKKAREHVSAGQRLLASDVIFADSIGATTVAETNLAIARTEQRAAADQDVAALQQRELYALGGAALGCLTVALFLVPLARPVTPQDTREALRALISDGAPAGGTLLLRPESPAKAPVPSIAPAPSAPPAAEASAQVAESHAPRASVNLPATARVCSDLARVLDPADLPRLLEQAAVLLNASGLIVWVADRSGSALFPTLTHGYGPAVLARMSSIPRDADNAAAAAWRLGELRTVTAQGQAAGALVTPIVTAEGCVGVLAAETRNGSETDENTRAISRILAAQLATLVTTVPTETTRDAQD
jgi:hypothetical protein